MMFGRNDNIRERHGDSGLGSAGESEILKRIQRGSNLLCGVSRGNIVDNRSKLLLGDLLVDERIVNRKSVVQLNASERGCEQCASVRITRFLNG